MRSDILLFERMSDLARDISFDEKKAVELYSDCQKKFKLKFKKIKKIR